jgi:hypothetical protein
MGGGGGQQQQGVPTVGVVGRNGHGPHSVGHLSPPVHPTADPLSNYSARPFSYRRIEEDSDDESMISLDFDNVASASGSPGGREGDGGEGNDELLYEEARGTSPSSLRVLGELPARAGRIAHPLTYFSPFLWSSFLFRTTSIRFPPRRLGLPSRRCLGRASETEDAGRRGERPPWVWPFW